VAASAPAANTSKRRRTHGSAFPEPVALPVPIHAAGGVAFAFQLALTADTSDDELVLLLAA
jgi:hypothetical protein